MKIYYLLMIVQKLLLTVVTWIYNMYDDIVRLQKFSEYLKVDNNKNLNLQKFSEYLKVDNNKNLNLQKFSEYLKVDNNKNLNLQKFSEYLKRKKVINFDSYNIQQNYTDESSNRSNHEPHYKSSSSNMRLANRKELNPYRKHNNMGKQKID
ncbi:hypothetical protein H8356DRAFT_1436339 [Neocallimastix lanati (nom. inval.)]|nr:hypothetical protein H8356DRAFT_1436339 [Neocallimastix sp. JGI-2020a]